MEDWINASFVMSNPRPPSMMRQFNLVQRRSHDDYGMAAQNGGTMEYRELNNNNTVHYDDKWLIASLGEKKNWDSLTEEEKMKLRGTQGGFIVFVAILVLLLIIMSVVLLLRSGGKISSLTTALGIIAAVFVALGKFPSKPVEYYYSVGEYFEAARLRVIEGYMNIIAALLAITALFDLIVAVLFGKW